MKIAIVKKIHNFIQINNLLLQKRKKFNFNKK